MGFIHKDIKDAISLLNAENIEGAYKIVIKHHLRSEGKRTSQWLSTLYADIAKFFEHTRKAEEILNKIVRGKGIETTLTGTRRYLSSQALNELELAENNIKNIKTDLKILLEEAIRLE